MKPLVIIGDKGLTEEVIAEVDRALRAHELIKVRAVTDDRDARGTWMETICARLDAYAVQQIGKVLVIYRENPEEKKNAETTGTSRPRSRTPSPRPESAPRRRRPRTSR